MATISDPEAGDVTERESDDTQVSSAQAAPGADKGTHTTGDISCVDTSDTKRIEDITKKDKSEKEDKEKEKMETDEGEVKKEKEDDDDLDTFHGFSLADLPKPIVIKEELIEEETATVTELQGEKVENPEKEHDLKSDEIRQKQQLPVEH